MDIYIFSVNLLVEFFTNIVEKKESAPFQ